jgi:hypothetical protein
MLCTMLYLAIPFFMHDGPCTCFWAKSVPVSISGFIDLLDIFKLFKLLYIFKYLHVHSEFANIYFMNYDLGCLSMLSFLYDLFANSSKLKSFLIIEYIQIEDMILCDQ